MLTTEQRRRMPRVFMQDLGSTNLARVQRRYGSNQGPIQHCVRYGSRLLHFRRKCEAGHRQPLQEGHARQRIELGPIPEL